MRLDVGWHPDACSHPLAYDRGHCPRNPPMHIFEIALRLTLVATMFATVSAHAAVTDATTQGFTAENTVTVPVAPDVAWTAMVRDVDRWWPKDHTWWSAASTLSIEPRAGGCFCERAADGVREAQHLQVVHVEPGAALRMTGGLGPLQGMGLHGVLDVTFKAVDGGTSVTWRYRAGGYTPDDLSKLAPIVDRVQAQQLAGLATHLGAR